MNKIKSNHQLECISTILFLLDNENPLNQEEIIDGFKNWSSHKATSFSQEYILQEIKDLQDSKIIEKNLIGYSIARFKN